MREKVTRMMVTTLLETVAITNPDGSSPCTISAGLVSGDKQALNFVDCLNRGSKLKTVAGGREGGDKGYGKQSEDQCHPKSI